MQRIIEYAENIGCIRRKNVANKIYGSALYTRRGLMPPHFGQAMKTPAERNYQIRAVKFVYSSLNS